MDVQCQSGTSDCGIAFATSLCLGLDPVHITYTQGDLRNHLITCLTSRVISDFLQTKRKRYSVRKRSVVKYGVYCICRQLESGQMLQCCTCFEWFHDECVTVPEEVWKDKKIKWICNKCSEEN